MSARNVAAATLTVLGILVGAYVLWLASEVVLLLFLGVLVASAIEPAVDRLRRGPFSRGQGVLVVYMSIVGIVAVVALLVIPSMLQQISGFADQLPAQLQQAQVQVDTIGPRPLRDAASRALSGAQGFVTGRTPAAEPTDVVDAGLTVVHLVVAIVTIFVIAYYWLVERASLKRTVLQLAGPRHARRVNHLWVAIEARLGAWVRGQLILMATVGIGLGIGYVLLGFPGAFALALFAALAEMIPMVGPYLAVAPALLVALTISPTTALILLVYAVAIQSLEGYVLVPRVMGHAVGVSPLVVFLGILVGATLGGLPGALVAVPIAGALQVVLQDLLSSDTTVAQYAGESSEGEISQNVEAKATVTAPVPVAPQTMVAPQHAHPVLPGGRIAKDLGPGGPSHAAFTTVSASHSITRR